MVLDGVAAAINTRTTTWQAAGVQWTVERVGEGKPAVVADRRADGAGSIHCLGLGEADLEGVPGKGERSTVAFAHYELDDVISLQRCLDHLEQRIGLRRSGPSPAPGASSPAS